MLANPLLHHILDDEALTRNLGDAEARVLVEWLVEQAEDLAQTVPPEQALAQVRLSCRRGRAIARFVTLWCLEQSRGAAGQLAAVERFGWPLPDASVDPCELMQTICSWEDRARLERQSRSERADRASQV
jgi:hypothetical protein